MHYLLADEEIAAIRDVAAALRIAARAPGSESLKRAPLSERFFLALQGTRALRGEIQQDELLDRAEHDLLPQKERYWLLGQEAVGRLARLSCALERAVLSTQFRESFADEVEQALSTAQRLSEVTAWRLQDADRPSSAAAARPVRQRS